jgi:hypothetical protein
MESIDQGLESLSLEIVHLKSQPPKIKPSKSKVPFCLKTKLEIKSLSPVDAIQYEIDLHKFETDKLKVQLRQINQDEGRTRRSTEVRQFIIWGRMIQSQIKDHPERQAAYRKLEDWMDQYLTKDSDRQLLGFPLLGQSVEENHDRN